MNQYSEIPTLQYMGSKVRIISHICDPIIKNKSIQAVVDLFAGTGSVGYALNEPPLCCVQRKIIFLFHPPYLLWFTAIIVTEAGAEIECANQKRKSPRKVCNRLIPVIFLAPATPDNLVGLILRYQSVAFWTPFFYSLETKHRHLRYTMSKI